MPPAAAAEIGWLENPLRGCFTLLRQIIIPINKEAQMNISAREKHTLRELANSSLK